jgi:hypothetical protein
MYYPTTEASGQPQPRRNPPKQSKLQVTRPVTYALLGTLAQPRDRLNEPITEEATAASSAPLDSGLQNDNGESDDDWMSSESDIDSALDGKMLAKQRRLRDEREKKKQARIQELANSKRIYEASQPGRIPHGLGVIHINGGVEQDNTLWGTPNGEFYVSPLTNIMYVGHAASVANDDEGAYDCPYQSVSPRRLYSILLHGFLMNPHSVSRAVRFITDTKENSQD